MDSWLSPHATLAFFALMMAIVSFWQKPSAWIWGSFLVIAGMLGFFANLLTPAALFPIGALFILHGALLAKVEGLPRLILVALAGVISIGLWLHLFPGFYPFTLIKDVEISSNATPYTLSMSFDKPFTGFFVLALSLPLIRNFSAFKELLKSALPLSLLGTAILAIIALNIGIIAWDPKFSALFWLYAPINLILVIIPEEAFMRGFIQNECLRLFGGKGVVSQILSILITSLLFAALHYHWIKNMPFLLLIFAAGIVYGSIYQLTKAIEASILCHFLFNIVHFTLFSYPILKSAV